MPLAARGVDVVVLVNFGTPADGSTKYLPQHGEFCSYGVSVGKKFDGDPEQFLVQDGRLFLFLNAATRAKFLEDVAATANTADCEWSRIEHIAAAEL